MYVRYGEPQHNSRSSSLRFETDPMVVRVRNLLMAALTDEERNEIRQFHRRIRTSTRDVPRDGLNTLGRRYLSSDDRFVLTSDGVCQRPGAVDHLPRSCARFPRIRVRPQRRHIRRVEPFEGVIQLRDRAGGLHYAR